MRLQAKYREVSKNISSAISIAEIFMSLEVGWMMLKNVRI